MLDLAGKRLIHNVSERKRRNTIKSGFQALKDKLPSAVNDKFSKIDILNKGKRPYFSLLSGLLLCLSTFNFLFFFFLFSFLLLSAVRYIEALQSRKTSLVVGIKTIQAEIEDLKRSLSFFLPQQLLEPDNNNENNKKY